MNWEQMSRGFHGISVLCEEIFLFISPRKKYHETFWLDYRAEYPRFVLFDWRRISCLKLRHRHFDRCDSETTVALPTSSSASRIGFRARKSCPYSHKTQKLEAHRWLAHGGNNVCAIFLPKFQRKWIDFSAVSLANESSKNGKNGDWIHQITIYQFNNC